MTTIRSRSIPLRKYGLKDRMSVDEATGTTNAKTGELWGLQQRIFDAKMKVLSTMTRDGVKPVKPLRLRIVIEIETEVIPDTVPFNGVVPESEHYLDWYEVGRGTL